MEIVNKLELHYYFDDESHSMDAHIRNKCERELLAIIYEVASHLGIEIKIDSEAIREGGLKDLWKLFGKHSGQISVIIAIIALVLSRIPVSDKAQDDLKNEETKLSILEKQLTIAKLKKELNLGGPQAETVENIINSVNANLKITTRRSNFYKNVNHCHKVNKIGFSKLGVDNAVVGTESVVKKHDFAKFIFHSNELPTLTEEDAVIEIISPVLKKGNYKWRGVYNGETISFTMSDKDYKHDVLIKKVSFQHGSSIRCILKIHRELNELGEVNIKSYSVNTVLERLDGGAYEETPQGKRYNFNKKQIDDQRNLF